MRFYFSLLLAATVGFVNSTIAADQADPANQSIQELTEFLYYMHAAERQFKESGQYDPDENGEGNYIDDPDVLDGSKEYKGVKFIVLPPTPKKTFSVYLRIPNDSAESEKHWVCCVVQGKIALICGQDGVVKQAHPPSDPVAYDAILKSYSESETIITKDVTKINIVLGEKQWR